MQVQTHFTRRMELLKKLLEFWKDGKEVCLFYPWKIYSYYNGKIMYSIIDFVSDDMDLQEKTDTDETTTKPSDM